MRAPSGAPCRPGIVEYVASLLRPFLSGSYAGCLHWISKRYAADGRLLFSTQWADGCRQVAKFGVVDSCHMPPHRFWLLCWGETWLCPDFRTACRRRDVVAELHSARFLAFDPGQILVVSGAFSASRPFG